MRTWPEGFMWGTGASSTQCEGAAAASDWWDWERAGRAPISGDGNGFAARHGEDFALLAGLGLTHHRLSIEWARVEPEPGVHDPAAVEHYRAVLSAARDAGVTPWVCLHHFTLPRWFAAEGGFLEETGRTRAWARHVDFVAETFGDLVGGWQPVNEANYYARLCYDGGRFPPGHDDREEVAIVDEAILLANAEAAVRLRQTGAPVASILGLSPIVPQDDDPETVGYAGALHSILWEPGLGLFRDGTLRVRRREPVERPDLAGSFDLIGFSYYSAIGVNQGRVAIHPPDAPVSPLGYGIWADGLGLVLERLHTEVPGTPLLVAEYGVGTDDDTVRAAYVERGLEVTHDAIARGIDVSGFFHWTAVDNYEWLLGYDVAFGIIDRERNVRPSARVLQREALRRDDRAVTDTLAPYPDGRWSLADHLPDRAATVWCRGNVGEVFPNVVSPLSGSLYMGAMEVGQADAVRDWGLVTETQYESFEEGHASLTGVFGGYLYGNVTLARSAVARSPGLTVELVDEQMFGISDAPPHQPSKGERDIRVAVKTMRAIASSMRRPDDSRLRADQAAIAAYVGRQPTIATASNDELVAVARSMTPWARRMMHHLLLASMAAGISRSMLERVVASLHEPGLENRLTAGLGTVESAQPAQELWTIGRTVAASPSLTALFDDRRFDEARGEDRDFASAFDRFVSRHGSRGPDEWELSSPTWASDPTIALAMIDRLRLAPGDRDPTAVGARLGAERASLILEIRDRLPWFKRRLFDIALRATMAYAPQREASKAAFVRALYPARQALAELARRSSLSHDDFFLLAIDEVPAALEGHPPDVTERSARRDYLQARVPPFWFESPLSSPESWSLRERQHRPDGSARTITGMGVCSGVATGTARVVLRPDEPGELGSGDILVAPITDPAWTPLFLAAAGVVVDVGAQQSHAAIVSRELGIPAVVSATGASTTIPNGALVTVDGSTGVVTIHADSQRAGNET